MTVGRRRVVAFLAGLTMALGAAGFVAAGRVAFDDRRGWPLWHILHFNRLGASVTIGLGLLALIGVTLGLRAMVVAAAIGFAACWVDTLVFTGGAHNFLGGRGDTLSFFLAAGLGLLILALAPEAGEERRAGVEHARGPRRSEPVKTDSPGP
jgi:hypothetical protein